MPELERYMLAKLAELDRVVRAGYAEYDFNRVYSGAVQFLHQRTVGVLFRHPQGLALLRLRSRHRAGAATRTVIDEIFRRVVTWFAPILCFTMEEAWLLRFPERK